MSLCMKCGVPNADDARFCSTCGAAMPELPVPPVAPSAPAVAAAAAASQRYAGFWIRLLASVIDSILVNILFRLVALILGLRLMPIFGADEFDYYDDLGSIFLTTVLLSTLINWLWFTIAESSAWQATPGKKLLGLKVTDERGQRIGFGRANGRYWSKILSALLLCIGYLMVAWTDRKQGLHDKIAGTLVVRG